MPTPRFRLDLTRHLGLRMDRISHALRPDKIVEWATANSKESTDELKKRVARHPFSPSPSTAAPRASRHHEPLRRFATTSAYPAAAAP